MRARLLPAAVWTGLPLILTIALVTVPFAAGWWMGMTKCRLSAQRRAEGSRMIEWGLSLGAGGGGGGGGGGGPFCSVARVSGTAWAIPPRLLSSQTAHPECAASAATATW